ncbi:hypothetical protein B9479_007744 [Cryptococcus floricola]|uniref:Uncharacterized protein n=1 Tax=Cryptococcus floricola TaxID=2591691 RepID=A0A5D3ANL3_9TREE|nr:hypothetical protein B9479_007744 [Cryptococcus floricola]
MTLPRPITAESETLNPSTPPPSLATTYSRASLLSLRTPDQPPPNPIRLQSFSIFRSNSMSDDDWGIDESLSKVLGGRNGSEDWSFARMNAEAGVKMAAGRPVSIRKDSGSSSGSDGDEVLFHFTSATPSRMAPPKILTDFSNPFAQTVKPEATKAQNLGVGVGLPIRLGPRKSSTNALDVFQTFPSSVNSASSSLHLGPAQMGSLGKDFGRMRLGRRDSAESVGSVGSATSGTSRASMGGLNPFAAPFPLPPTAVPNAPNSSSPSSSSTSPSIPAPTASLPLPNPPMSLPARPPGPLPPVFIKRESAALPQPMSLPDIAPLGKDWEGDNSLSGNEKRRMSGVLGMMPSAVGGGGGAAMGGGSLGGSSATSRTGSVSSATSSTQGQDQKIMMGSSYSQRPPHLAKLGERLRESVSHTKQERAASVRA